MRYDTGTSHLYDVDDVDVVSSDERRVVRQMSSYVTISLSFSGSGARRAPFSSVAIDAALFFISSAYSAAFAAGSPAPLFPRAKDIVTVCPRRPR